MNSVIDIIQRHRKLHDLFLDFLPRGSSDVATLGGMLDDWKIDTEEFSLFVQEILDEQSIGLQDVDIIAFAYEFILSQVLSELERIDRKIWLSVVDLNMMVAGNYIATCFDGHDDVFKAYGKAIRKALKKDDSHILEMFLERVV